MFSGGGGLAFPFMPPVTSGSSTTSSGSAMPVAPEVTSTTATTSAGGSRVAPAADNPFATLMAQMMSAPQEPVSFSVFVLCSVIELT